MVKVYKKLLFLLLIIFFTTINFLLSGNNVLAQSCSGSGSWQENQATCVRGGDLLYTCQNTTVTKYANCASVGGSCLWSYTRYNQVCNIPQNRTTCSVSNIDSGQVGGSDGCSTCPSGQIFCGAQGTCAAGCRNTGGQTCQTWLNNNCGGSSGGGFCGDGSCNNGESCSTCSGDCGGCSGGGTPSCTITFSPNSYSIPLSDHTVRVSATVAASNMTVDFVRFRAMDTTKFLLYDNANSTVDQNKDAVSSPYRVRISPVGQGTAVLRARAFYNGNPICARDVNVTITAPAPPTVDLQVNGGNGPITVASGSNATLSWTTANVPSDCTASNAWTGTKSYTGGSEVASGITTSRTFTLSCVGYNGATVSDSVTVNVTLPPSIDLRANAQNGPLTLPYGSSATLTWSGNSLSSCSASGSWSGAKATSNGTGETQSNLTSNRTYTITCIGTNGATVSDSVVVNITPPASPTVDLRVNTVNGPVSVAYGGSVSLSWSTSNISGSCTASNGWTGSKSPTGGPETMSNLTSNRTYTLSCTGTNGATVSDSVSVTVGAAPIPSVDLRANGSNGPLTLASGSNVSLSWTTSNVSGSCTALQSWTGSKATSGTETQSNLTSNRTYELRCSGVDGTTVSDAVTVNISAPAGINLMANNSNGPISIANGGSANLTWTGTNVQNCTASGSWSGAKSTTNTVGENQTNLTSNRTYTLTCAGTGVYTGTNYSDSVSVTVAAAATPTLDLRGNGVAGSTTVAFGGSVTLSWTTSNISGSCTASNGWTGSKTGTGGSETMSNITSNRTYQLNCTGTNGTVVTDTLAVTVGSAPIPSLDLQANGSNGPLTLASGSNVNLSWTSSNISGSCTASGSWSGSKSSSGSESQSNLTTNRTYTLSCTGTNGTTVSDSVTVNISAPAGINIFANNSNGPISIANGGSANLTWTGTNVQNCSASGSWSGAKATTNTVGENQTNLTSNRTYTITCAGSGVYAGNNYSDSVTVNVAAAATPTVNLTGNGSGGPVSVAFGGSVTLNWTTSNISGSCTATGSWSGAKTGTGGSETMSNITSNRTYTLSCTGTNGTTISDSVSVTAGSAPIPSVDLRVNGGNGPISVANGSSVTLSWTTSNVTSNCTALQAWTGSKTPSGSQTMTGLTSNRTYELRCTGVDGTTQVSDTVTVNVLAPTSVDIRANNSNGPLAIYSGTNVNLTWTGTNVQNCSASGNWSGAKSTTNTVGEMQNNVTSNRTYTITCNGIGSEASFIFTDSVQITMRQPGMDLRVNGSNGPIVVADGSSITLTWTSQDLDFPTCVATENTPSSAWTTTPNKAASGSQTITNIIAIKQFTLRCTNGVAPNQVFTDTVSVTPYSFTLPTAELRINNNTSATVTVPYGTQPSFSWITSSNVTSCSATSNNWPTGITSPNPAGGTVTMNPVTSVTPITYSISCQNAGGDSVSDSISVRADAVPCAQVTNIVSTQDTCTVGNVNTGTITWQWGRSSNADRYQVQVVNSSGSNVGSQVTLTASSVCNATTCSWTASNLAPNRSYNLRVVSAGSSTSVCSPSSTAAQGATNIPVDICTYNVSGRVYLYNEDDVVYNSATNRCTFPNGAPSQTPVGFGGAQISIGSLNVTTAGDGSYTLTPQMTGSAQAVSLSNIGTNLPYCTGNGVFSISEANTTGLDFYITAEKDPWFQVEGGDIHANNDSQDSQALVVYNPVSIACLLDSNCKPYTITRRNPGLSNTSGFLTYGNGRIDTWSNTGSQIKNISQDDPNANTVRVGQSFMDTPRETYGYLYRLHEFGLNPQSYYVSPRDPNNAQKPTGGSNPAYFHSGNIRIRSNWSIAAGEKTVLFVDGNVEIQNPITVANGGFFAIVSTGNITFAGTLNSAQGIFIADGQIIVQGRNNNPSNDSQFVGQGSFVGWSGILLERDLPDNNATPALLFRYRADLVQNAPDGFKTKHYRWREVAP